MRRYWTTCICMLCALALCGALAGAAQAAAPGALAWGAGTEGQLGNGELNNSRTPTPVKGLTEVVSVAAGADHSLALLANGTVMAWGANKSGQLGNGTTTPSSVPVAVSGLSEVAAIAAGDEFSLALRRNGTVMAWGANANGELGNGTITNSDVPVEVQKLTEVTEIAAGEKNALALLGDGAVVGWGDDMYGQLGNGTTTTGELEPVHVSEITNATAIAAGSFHGLAVLATGEVKAWGYNNKGQLGDGSETLSNVPVAVTGLSGIKAVAGGEAFSLALATSGKVYAWGAGGSGQLGNGTKTQSKVPVEASGITEATEVAAGSNFSLALLANRTIMSWGANGSGQLGNGTTTATEVPTAISGVDEVEGIAAGAGGLHALAYGPIIPTVTGVSPAGGPPGGNSTVTITGTDFLGVSAVHFGSAEAVEYKVESAGEIKAVSPSGTGVVNVTVTAPGGTSPLVQADRFSYLPVISSVAPSTGPQYGGTTVVITGSNFTGASAVSFGGVAAQSFKVEGDSTISAVSPAGVGTVDVKVTAPGGTSEASTADQFTYESSIPEIGLCYKAGAKHKRSVHGGRAHPRGGRNGHEEKGDYLDSGCETPSATEGRYDWTPGPGKKPLFKLKAPKHARPVFETVDGWEFSCGAARGTGDFSGAKAIVNLQLTLTGCEIGGVGEHLKCSSAGAVKAGEITLHTLAGVFGIIRRGTKPEEDEIGLQLTPASGTTIMEFTCEGSAVHVWRGGLIVPVKANKMQKAATLVFLAVKGHQHVEGFEGRVKEVLEASTGGAPFEQGAVKGELEQQQKEAIEVSSVR